MKLNKYDMSHNWLTGFRTGQLVPTMIQDVTPGEVWHGNSTSVVRIDPLVRPTFMSMKVFTKTFYIPYRILDADFPEWWAGQDGGSYTWPQTDIGSSQIAYTDFFLKFGIPLITNRVNRNISSFAFHAYNMIWNKHFRSQDVAEVALTSKAVHRVSHPSGTYYGNMRANMQLGSAVTIDTSGATTDVPTVRDAWALQRLQEHRELYGDKYIDQLKRFGIKVPYGLVDEPVPVASGRGVIGISEVVETATTTVSSSGQMSGHGIVAFQSRMKPRRFLEPGMLMQVAYARPRLSLYKKLDRMHLRDETSENSVYQPELALQSDAVVYSDEIFADTVSTTNFAYVDNYDWLRSANDVVAAEMTKTAYIEYSAHKRLTSLPTLSALQYVDDYDDLFQNGASANRADIQMYNAHRIKKLSPVRRKGRS